MNTGLPQHYEEKGNEKNEAAKRLLDQPGGDLQGKASIAEAKPDELQEHP